MSEAQANAGVESSPQCHDPAEGRTAKLVYLLYLFSSVHGLVILLATYGFDDYNADFINSQAMIFSTLVQIAGVVLAYLYNDTGHGWIAGHYCFQIRTFWIGGLLLVFSVMLFAFVPDPENFEETVLEYLVGNLFIVVVMVTSNIFIVGWWVVRNIRGYKRVVRGEPIPNPKSWFFGG